MAAHLDFETYSEAGFVWDAETRKFKPPPGARLKGLPTVGAAPYAQHPSTEVLTASYRLPGQPKRRWNPTMGPPQDLFDHAARGEPIFAHNSMFEWLIWKYVCVPKYGWPEPPDYAFRCTMATAHVNSYPGKLANLGDVLQTKIRKDKDGDRLLKKFSMPRDPTKGDPRTRITPADDPPDFARLESYCDTDLDTEDEAGALMPPMEPEELNFWWVDQEINRRGIAIDRQGVRDCIAVLEMALARYGDEFRRITDGLDPTQLQEAKGWLHARGVHLDAMDEEHIDDALTWPHVTGDCRRILEIRQLIGSASVKKLYAMENQACDDDRLRNLIVHHGARTGRPTGEGPQPLNLPRSGPDLVQCKHCVRPFRPDHTNCPWCGTPAVDLEPKEWSAEAADHVLSIMAMRSLDLVEFFFGPALLAISGCIRALFVAGPGHDLIASDYTAIEAVVTATLAGEQWRIDAFRNKEPIYLLGASKITGVPVADYVAYKERTGKHHPDRQKIGKVGELAGGFGGWIGAWKAFGATDPDDVLKAQVLAWRKASPAIVELWGGQYRGAPWDPGVRQEYYGYEGAAVQALMYPNVTFQCRGIRFQVQTQLTGKPALIIRLLSGRKLTYHEPRLTKSTRDYAHDGEKSTYYMTWNTNPKYGSIGWVPMSTFGGRLTENIVQATAHDILRYAILNLRAAGYPTVLHVYDEVVVEVPTGTGSIEEVERIMSTMPPWAADWPVAAAGGWRGRRYRKD